MSARKLTQIHLTADVHGYRLVTGSDKTSVCALEEAEPQNILLQSCPPGIWPQDSYAAGCPRPVLVSKHHQQQLQDLYGPLTIAITDIVQRWWTDHDASYKAPDPSLAQQRGHVGDVSEHLRKSGLLKIKLGFSDDNSQYLKRLLLSLHKNHGHHLPIMYSATCGWFWDIRPSTDVLHADHHGGGTLSLMDVEKLYMLLSPETKAALMRPEYQIRTPPEFVKEPLRQSIVCSVLATEQHSQSNVVLRYREDILIPLGERAARALAELRRVLRDMNNTPVSILRLTSADMPERSILLADNRRWLHARTNVIDPRRNLRRVRWDAAPFGSP
ncbi:putative TauD/TfdA-like domain-containing protein [Seiridium cardinale]